MFNINVGYPSEDEEFQIVRLTTMSRRRSTCSTCSAAKRCMQLQEIVRKVPVADHVIRYALQFTPADAQDRGGDVPGLRQGIRRLGRRPAGQPVPDPRRQGPGAAQGPLPRQHGRHPPGRAAGAAAPHRDQLQRRGRGDQERHDRAEADRLHPAAAVRRAGHDHGEDAAEASVAERTARIFDSNLGRRSSGRRGAQIRDATALCETGNNRANGAVPVDL